MIEQSKSRIGIFGFLANLFRGNAEETTRNNFWLMKSAFRNSARKANYERYMSLWFHYSPLNVRWHRRENI